MRSLSLLVLLTLAALPLCSLADVITSDNVEDSGFHIAENVSLAQDDWFDPGAELFYRVLLLFKNLPDLTGYNTVVSATVEIYTYAGGTYLWGEHGDEVIGYRCAYGNYTWDEEDDPGTLHSVTAGAVIDNTIITSAQQWREFDITSVIQGVYASDSSPDEELTVRLDGEYSSGVYEDFIKYTGDLQWGDPEIWDEDFVVARPRTNSVYYPRITIEYGFYDDFNDGDYNGWSVWSGSWSAANGYLRMTPGTPGTIAKANTDNDLEFSFSYVCNDTSNNDRFLVVSPRYASNGDRIYLFIKAADISLNQRVNSVWTGFDGVTVASTQGSKYYIRVVCDRTNVEVYRNEEGAAEQKILETTACTVASTNYVTFTPQTDADFNIDNVIIK